MRPRHKPPTLVSMWMLDVFCCALGCVTLLWLLNTREAGDQAKRAGATLDLLGRTEADLKARQAELLATKAEFDQARRRLNADIEDLRGKLLATTAERDDAAKQLALTRGDLTAAEAKLAAAAARSREQDDLLARKQSEAKDLAAKVAAGTRSADDLARLVRAREKERDDLAVKAKQADDQARDLGARLRAAAKEAQDAAADAAAGRKAGADELAAARAAIRDVQAKADQASATIIDLQGQKARLADKVDQLRAESEARFAGIAMTGRRVVFVVDTSGSMKLVDEKTPAPAKWPTVVETVAKVMRSLPELDRYQVVTFARRADYLLGGGAWQPYRGEESARQVADALRRVEPAGDTNLFDGLDLAFRLRRDGLDTVYLFSDGLPTSGPGLTPDQDKGLREADRSAVLARHLRRTLLTNWNAADGRPRVRVNSVGFFYESPDVGAFLWALSRENQGSFVGMPN